jgi:type II secretory pathway component GspD/PulD (secretin)
MESGAPGAGELIPLIQIEDVPLTEAIRNLARQANVSFLFDPRVSATNQPNISIRLENVTAVEALTALLDNHTLVLVKDPRTRIARITIRDPKAEDPLISQIVQLRYADPTNIISLVKATLSPRSQVIADPRTSQVLVTTTEKEMNAATNLIERLDLPTKQVLIEAKLYETARNPQSLKGVDWSGTLENQRVILGNNAVGGTPASEPIPGSGGTPTTPASGGTVGGILSDPKLLMNASAGSFFNPAMAFLNADGVSAVVSFLNKDSDSEIVATPRAVTLDNQSAKLEVSRAFPIFKITPGSANSPAGAEITYTNLGVILNVTPRIAADKNISLRVVPEVSSIDGKDEQVINGVKNVANIYAIRRVETHVMIPSSHTLVMGGLISDTKSKGYTKVPIAGDIPVFGFAFRSESKRRNRSNLLMFITPTIVENEAFQSNEVGREFLQTKYFDPPDRKETAWDSAKPHDWTKPRK